MSQGSNKKRKTASSSSKEGIQRREAPLAISENSNSSKSLQEFEPFTLDEIRNRIKALVSDIPEIPENGFYIDVDGGSTSERKLDKVKLREWANRLQIVLEELGLLLCCVTTATYRWGSDRTGAADQNLSLLNEELNNTQDQIASRVTPRLRNVLTPVVDLVVDKTVTTSNKRRKKDHAIAANGEGGVNHEAKNGGENDNEYETVEVKQNFFSRHLEDPDFVHMCYEILARNSPMMRHVVLTNFHKMLRCLADYLAAHKNDSEHHRDFTY